MKALNNQNVVTIELSEYEALTLLEWLHNFNENERPELFQDTAEETLLFNLESSLETVIVSSFAANYHEKLSQAWEKVKKE